MIKDANGFIDPLADASFLALAEIENYTELVIDSSNQGDAKLIAFDAYGSIEYERVILYYNGLYTDAEIVAGMTIKIPNKVSIDTVVQVKTTGKRTVKI